MKCPVCETQNADSAKYCIECGRPLFKKCDCCMATSPVTAKFCPNCGKKFDAVDVNIIRYKNKLNFHDFISVNKSAAGKYIVVRDNSVYKLLDIRTLAPIFSYDFDDIGEQKDYQNFLFIRRNGKWGIVDPIARKLITDFIYDSYRTNDHSGPEFRVSLNGKWGKVDANTGITTVPHIYDDIEFDDRVKRNGYWGWLGQGREIVPCEYIHLESYVFSSNIRPSRHRNGKWGVIDRGGRIIIEFEYDEIEYYEPFGHSLYYLRKGNCWGQYLDGKRIPCKYTKDELENLKL